MSGKEKNPKKHKDRLKITVFDSLQEENQVEYKRRADMTPEDRLKEFEILQERVWGPQWTSQSMIKKLRIEKINWSKK